VGQVLSFERAKCKLNRANAAARKEVAEAGRKPSRSKVVKIFNLPDYQVRKRYVFILSVPKEPSEILNRLVVTMGIMVMLSATIF